MKNDLLREEILSVTKEELLKYFLRNEEALKLALGDYMKINREINFGSYSEFLEQLHSDGSLVFKLKYAVHAIHNLDYISKGIVLLNNLPEWFTEDDTEIKEYNSIRPLDDIYDDVRMFLDNITEEIVFSGDNYIMDLVTNYCEKLILLSITDRKAANKILEKILFDWFLFTKYIEKVDSIDLKLDKIYRTSLSELLSSYLDEPTSFKYLIGALNESVMLNCTDISKEVFNVLDLEDVDKIRRKFKR